MNEYTASNGMVVRPGGRDGELAVVERHETDLPGAMFGRYQIGADVVQALREFFRAERDEELGRWRWAENPDYVVYPRLSAVAVVFEPTSDGGILYRRGDPVHDMEGEAARAYFDAHPEPKPWSTAKEGELWLLRPADALNELPYIAVDDTDGQVSMGPRFFRVPEPRVFLPGRFPNEFIEGRRIWPESD